jgi:Tfp pilus assembly protein PilO
MSILRRWVAGSILAIAVILLAGWLLGVQPALVALAAAESERESVKVLNQSYEVSLADLRTLSEDLPALEDQRELSRTEIPDGPELSDLLGQLNDLAVTAGVSIIEVTANTPVVVGPELVGSTGVTDLVAIPVQISATGAASALDQFLRNAQFGPRLIYVSRVTQTEEAGFGQVTLEGFVFVLPPEGAGVPTVDDEFLGDSESEGEPAP